MECDAASGPTHLLTFWFTKIYFYHIISNDHLFCNIIFVPNDFPTFSSVSLRSSSDAARHLHRRDTLYHLVQAACITRKVNLVTCIAVHWRINFLTANVEKNG